MRIYLGDVALRGSVQLTAKGLGRTVKILAKDWITASCFRLHLFHYYHVCPHGRCKSNGVLIKRPFIVAQITLFMVISLFRITYALQQMICLSVVQQGLPTIPLRFLQAAHYSSVLGSVRGASVWRLYWRCYTQLFNNIKRLPRCIWCNKTASSLNFTIGCLDFGWISFQRKTRAYDFTSRATLLPFLVITGVGFSDI